MVGVSILAAGIKWHNNFQSAIASKNTFINRTLVMNQAINERILAFGALLENQTIETEETITQTPTTSYGHFTFVGKATQVTDSYVILTSQEQQETFKSQLTELTNRLRFFHHFNTIFQNFGQIFFDTDISSQQQAFNLYFNSNGIFEQIISCVNNLNSQTLTNPTAINVRELQHVLSRRAPKNFPAPSASPTYTST